ncbi:hypothetical protein GINT2_001275 [Glugoides intestinalis]
MDSLKTQIQSIFSRTFYGPNPLPLPTYCLSAIFMSKFPQNTLTISLLMFLLSKAIIASRFYKKTGYGIISFVIIFLLSLGCFSKSTSISFYFVEVLAFFCYEMFIKDQYAKAVFLLSLIATVDFVFLPIAATLLAFNSIKIYKKLINPKVNMKSTLIHACYTTFLFISLPFVALIAISSIDLAIRNTHSDASLSFSIPFQTSLKNFNITKGFEKGHPSNYTEEPESSAYVMDRAQIALLNKKHKAFFTLNKSVVGSKKFSTFGEIHKIHKEEFEDEEPRFIKNGDHVKFKNVYEEGFLGVKRDDVNVKFITPTLGSFEESEDLWEVVCDGYLKARSTEVKFINISSGDLLCAKMVKSTPTLHASYYSEINSRNFYIADVYNHPYYKTMFKDPKASQSITKFKISGALNLLFEYLCAIDFKFNSKKEATSSSRTLLCAFPGFILILTVLLNNIAYKRYSLAIRISEQVAIFATVFASYLLFVPVIGMSPYIMSSFGLSGLFSLISGLVRADNQLKIKFQERFNKEL